MVIYSDMDGFLAKWDAVASIEDTCKPGYFLARQPEVKAIQLVKRLYEIGHTVKILSAVYGTRAAEEKKEWLKRYGLGQFQSIFVPYNQNKADYVAESCPVLIDDYSKNLHEWTNSGKRAVKFYNGINGTKGTWKGSSIHVDMDISEMIRVIEAAAP